MDTSWQRGTRGAWTSRDNMEPEGHGHLVTITTGELHRSLRTSLCLPLSRKSWKCLYRQSNSDTNMHCWVCSFIHLLKLPLKNMPHFNSRCTVLHNSLEKTSEHNLQVHFSRHNCSYPSITVEPLIKNKRQSFAISVSVATVISLATAVSLATMCRVTKAQYVGENI